MKYIILKEVDKILELKSFFVSSVNFKKETKSLFKKTNSFFYFDFGDRNQQYTCCDSNYAVVKEYWDYLIKEYEPYNIAEELKEELPILEEEPIIKKISTLDKIIKIINDKDISEIKDFCRENGFNHPLLDFASKQDIINKIKEQDNDSLKIIYNKINEK